MSRIFHHPNLMAVLLAVSTLWVVCSALRDPSSQQLNIDNSSYDRRRVSGTRRSEISSRRKKRKRRKSVIIESDITDFGNPLIPDLSENEDEEKIIMALSQHRDEYDEERDRYRNGFSSGKSATALKTKKNRSRKRSKKNNNGTKKRHRRSQQDKEISMTPKPVQEISERVKSPEELSPLVGGRLHNVEKADPKIQETTGTRASQQIPWTPSLKDKSVTPVSPKQTTLSARQNLTTTVDASLTRFKMMKERNEEVLQKSRAQSNSSMNTSTRSAKKTIVHSYAGQNRPQSSEGPSSGVKMQSVARKNVPSFPTPKSEPVKSPQPEKTLPTTMSLTTPWARKFILSRPKDALLPIPREFLSDGFNLVQLAAIVEKAVEAMILRDIGRKLNTNSNVSTSNASLYKVALRLILQDDAKTDSNSTISSAYTPFQIQKAAEVLYTMVHARYVSSPRGLDTVRRMFKRNNEVGIEPIFGRCSRMCCNGMPLLPIGISDSYDIGGKGGTKRRARRYCPCCNETFYMWDSKVDGAAWGTSFAHLFLMAQGSEVFSATTKNMKIQQPTRKIFGFKIHPKANVNKLRNVQTP